MTEAVGEALPLAGSPVNEGVGMPPVELTELDGEALPDSGLPVKDGVGMPPVELIELDGEALPDSGFPVNDGVGIPPDEEVVEIMVTEDTVLVKFPVVIVLKTVLLVVEFRAEELSVDTAELRVEVL